jgi:hypothetical protein
MGEVQRASAVYEAEEAADRFGAILGDAITSFIAQRICVGFPYHVRAKIVLEPVVGSDTAIEVEVGFIERLAKDLKI